MSLVAKLRTSALMIGRDLARFIYNQLLLHFSPGLANAFYERLSNKQLQYLLGHGVLGRTSASFPWTITLSNGKPLHIAVNPHDRFSVGCAFDYKAHDTGLKRTQEFFLDRGGERSLYLDIGANIGVSSIYALSAGRKCWLFEPNIALHDFGKSLFAQNQFANARWEPVALSDAPGQARFFVSKSSFLSSFDRQNAESEGEALEIIVPMRTLDSYLAELLAAADELIVKIDVEGHEMQVLTGARQVISHYQPAVMIELFRHPEVRGDAWSWFSTMNYIGFGIFDEPLLRLCQLHSVDDLVSFGEINFVFLPADHRLRAELEAHVCLA